MVQTYHVVNALAPTSDSLSGEKTTPAISMKDWDHLSFIIQCGAGATGTSKITVEGCDDTTPTNTEAIAFRYQECLTGDTFGELKQVGAVGFDTAAAANKMYKIEVDARDLPEDMSYVRLKAVEQVDSSVTAGIIAVLTNPRYAGAVVDSVLV